jgi:DNA-binding LytR/AlgR family response regulator
MRMDEELRIAVADDMELDRERIAEMTRSILLREKIPHSISCYADGEELLAEIRGGRRFTLLLLDVMMGALNGIGLAGALRELGDRTMIVFISSSHEMARLGYRVDALRYVVKPVEEAELKEALLHCHRQWQAKKEILLPNEKGHYRTSFPDIQFVEAYDRGTRFVLSGETVYSSLKFSEVETMLPQSSFIHCHRAYLVNVAYVKRIRPREFVMRSGDLVPISKHRYAEVSKRFFDCISG